MYKAIDIAKWFIMKANDNGVKITKMKVLKLCYIAQGFHLSVFQEALFSDSIQAWKYGPVINMLYEQLSHYKKNPIKQNDPVIINAKGILESDNDTIEVLESVWNTFKDHSAFTLSDWSHRQGAAWDKAYNVENGKNILAYEISHDLIMEEFDDIIISPKRSREKRPGIQ